MKKIYTILGLCALTLCACQKENDVTVPDSGAATEQNVETTTYTLVIDKAATKAVLADGSDAEHINLNWKDGDVIAFQLADDTVVEAPVTVSGGTATATIATGGQDIADAWFPSNGKVKPTAIPAYQNRNTINIPLDGTVSGSTITFAEMFDWAIVRVSVTAGSRGAVRTLQFVKFKNNNGSAPVQQIQINTTETLSAAVTNYDFVVPACEGNTIEIIFRDSDGYEYRRKATAAMELENRKVYVLPTVADIDDTGKHIWFFGNDAATANAAETPILYWWKQSGANNSTNIDTGKVAQHDGYTTYTMDDKADAMTVFQAWVCAEFNKFYSADGTTRSNARSTSFPQYGTERGGGDYIPFVAIHTGNYPIFAIKMSNPKNYGTSRKIRLQADTRETLDGIAAMTYVDGVGNGDNKYSYLDGYADEDDTIIYYDLSTANIGGKGVLPNARVIPMKTWQLRFYDVTYASAQSDAPTFNMYWAGFFHNTAELTAFAAAN